MNEGHAAFLGLERTRHFVRTNKLEIPRSALQIVAAAGIFTTHTPVPAGNDAFPRELMVAYFGDYPAQVGIDFEYFFSLGQATINKENNFSMTILALRTSRRANGVSKLHGEVSKGLVERRLGRACPRTRCRSPASPTASTRRPGRHPSSWTSTRSISVRTGRRTLTERGLLAARQPHPGRSALGHAPEAQGAAGGLSPGNACGRSANGSGIRPRHCGRSTTSSTRKS